jgi:hypothetical protein
MEMIVLRHLKSRLWRPAAVVAVLCALVSVLAVSPAGAAQSGGRLTAKLTAVTIGAALPASPAGGSSLPVIPGCHPSIGRYNRTQVCWPDGFDVTIYNDDDEPVGEIDFTLIEDMQLNPSRRSFSEKVWVYYVEPTGEVPAIDMTFFSVCDSPCKATDHFPEGAPLRSPCPSPSTGRPRR